MKKYVCDLCGLIYDPELGEKESDVLPGTPFKSIPATWTCPMCGALKENFSPLEENESK